MNGFRALMISTGVLLLIHLPGAYLTGTGFLFPDLTLVSLILVSKRLKPRQAMAAGFAAGLFQDLLAGSLLGIFALAKTASCFAAVKFHAALSPEHDLARMTSLVIPAVIHFSLVFAIRFPAAGLFRLILLYLLPPLTVTVCALLITDAAARRYWRMPA